MGLAVRDLIEAVTVSIPALYYTDDSFVCICLYE